MAWGIYVDWHCIGYDAGRPFWPCEAPSFILALINAPSVVVAQVISNIWTAAPRYFNYAVGFPCILFGWWFVGTRFDFGLLGVGAYKRRWTWATLIIAGAAALLGLLAWSLWQDIAFHRRFPNSAERGYLGVLGDLRSLPAYLWLIVLIVAFGVAAFRVFRGQTGQTHGRLASARTRRGAALGLIAYCVCVAGACLHVRELERRKQAEYDLRSVIIKGKVVDDRGLPVSAVEVDLVPLLEDIDAQSRQTVKEWTDKNGDYTIRSERTGRFFLAVLWNAPPSTKLPFLTRYYPDAPDQRHAETLEITAARHLSLTSIRLHRLQLVKVPVSVSWSNGKPEPAAYLFFANTLFPEHGAIGDETLHESDDGTVSLPAGFDYRATAQVDCDGGHVIANAYTPELTVSTKPTNAPISTLQFILPGEPCRVWHSK